MSKHIYIYDSKVSNKNLLTRTNLLKYLFKTKYIIL